MYDKVHLCLSDLLDQDLSSYEYFYALPTDIQHKIEENDVRSFDQLLELSDRYRSGSNSIQGE